MFDIKFILPFSFSLSTLVSGVAFAGDIAACQSDVLKPVFVDIEKTDQDARGEFSRSYEKALAESKSRGAPIDSATYDALFVPMKKVDAINQERLEKIIADCGWPKAELLGKQALEAAFIVVQHASLEFQRKYLANIEGDFKNGHLPALNYAMLIDRILTRENKEQLYGTQSYIMKDGDKHYFPIQDSANLNARRIAMGLKPLKDFPLPAPKE